ncbi:MAG TPA: VacJ family lipoprotein [Sphingomicrobium sp.]|nr:VacJ family lipoprotein [Sphingomicrobium sp.]
MSVSALATAMAFAAAAVPDGGTQPSVDAIVSELAALDHEQQEAGPAAGSIEASPPLVLAQSAAPPQSNPATSTDAVSSAQPESQVSTPTSEQSDIVVTGRRPSPDDPLEELNSTSFKITQSVDESFVAPIAFAYEDIMPRPVRKGLSNFLHNLGEPIVFLNFLLQLKPGKAAETLGRFAINTTLGAGGLVDVAKRKPFNLPRRENGFANTLGYYGVGSGPYFFLPLVGPTTLRDFIGGRLDLFLLPAVLPKWSRKPAVVVPIWVLKELDRRIEFEDELSQIRVTQDPYVTARTRYLQQRQAEIDALRGRRPSTIKPIVPTTPPMPVQNPPRDQIPGDSSKTSSIDLLGELPAVAMGGYTRLTGPVVSFGGEPSAWIAAPGLAFSF